MSLTKSSPEVGGSQKPQVSTSRPFPASILSGASLGLTVGDIDDLPYPGITAFLFPVSEKKEVLVSQAPGLPF